MKVFISYKRDVEPDEPLALRLYEALRKHCDVFIDQEKIEVGEVWGKRIQTELEACDYLIPLLSEHSVHSEMVEAEISTVHRRSKAGAGKPGILPVRVAYREPFDPIKGSFLGVVRKRSRRSFTPRQQRSAAPGESGCAVQTAPPVGGWAPGLPGQSGHRPN